MEPREVLDAREAFRASAIAFWTLIREGNSQAANRNTDAGDAVVERLAAEGLLLPALRPLLGDAVPAVRYAAAASLLNRGLDKECERVLEELQEDPRGLIAPTARLLLMTRRKRPPVSGT